jgi:hypothetical protein
MNDGTVIVLPTGYDPEGDEAVVKRERERLTAGAPCRHREVSIIEADGTLLCRRCDITVEPLDWIKTLASDWQWYRTRVAQAKSRAEQAEHNAERRVKEAQQSARSVASLPMAIGKRLRRTAASIAGAQKDLAEASVELAAVLERGDPRLTDHYLRSAEADIKRARSSLAKLLKDHGGQPNAV